MSARSGFFMVCALFLGAMAVPGLGALPPTGAGALDPTFGDAGNVVFDALPDSDNDGIHPGVVQPDGKLVVTGYVERDGADAAILVARFLDGGAPDPEFGTDGVAIHAIDESAYADSRRVAVTAGGRILVVGTARTGGVFRCIVLALRPDGSRDPTFAVGGIFRHPASGGVGSQCLNIAVQADGKLVVLGNFDNFKSNFLLRLSAAGVLDDSFGNQGVATLPGTTTNYVYGLALTPAGAIYLSGGKADGTSPGDVYRYTAAGVLDASFANGGQYATPVTNVFLHDVESQPDGSAVASGYHSGKHLVLKLTPAGVPDAGFGVNGMQEITLGTGYSAVSLELQRDGRILAGLQLNTPSGSRFAVARLTANGALDPTWGTAGISRLDLGTPEEGLTGIALGPDGKLWVYGNTYLSDSESAIVIARLLPDEITTSVVEFFNSGLVHYFITADPNEAAAIDAGAAGPGWTRTGQTFKSGGPNKVCRFYGNPDLNPATGTRRGPNSHFYTIEAAECAAVKLDDGWRFESYDFNGWPIGSLGCPEDTQPVMRAYNNRFAQNDSNHRYTTSVAIYDQMIAEGWTGEDTVFCAAL
ncbi:MAG: hypothetical protein KAX84_05360 [Burkholderiales bacterium]|nr:hypothetical protein [Burkholderiales bacterium]